MNEYIKQLAEISQSDETYKKITDIGNKFNLMMDLQGALASEIRQVIVGYKPAKDLVKNLKESLEIDEDLAERIAYDVNIDIFKPIQGKLQQFQEGNGEIKEIKEVIKTLPNLTISPIITPSTPFNHASLEAVGQFTIEKNIAPSLQYNTSNPNRGDIVKSIEDSTVPMVDHLLTTHVNEASKTEIKKILVDKRLPYTSDPYKEEI